MSIPSWQEAGLGPGLMVGLQKTGLAKEVHGEVRVEASGEGITPGKG